MKLAWLFPGQGSQAVGMGQSLYQGSPAAREALELSDRTLGVSLTDLMFEGPAEELQLTVNAQPAIVSVSLAALAAFRAAWQRTGGDPLPAPAYVAGHSVGEYAALVAAGVADDATALRLVRARAEAMHAAGNARPGGMTAVLGLARDAVEAACRAAREEVPGSYVSVANHNAETQVVIAGDKPGLTAAAQRCQAAGARRCVSLAVSGAFHSAAMEPASAALQSAVGVADLRDARIPVVANVTASPITAAADLRRELVDQVAKPVLWVDCVAAMLAAGVSAFIEFGSGKVLTTLLSRLDPAPEVANVGNPDEGDRAAIWLRDRLAVT